MPAENTEVVAQWENDKIDANNPGQIGSDGISDKYQRTVTFKVVGGYCSGTGNNDADIVRVVTLKNNSDVLDLNATITEVKPAVGAPQGRPFDHR